MSLSAATRDAGIAAAMTEGAVATAGAAAALAVVRAGLARALPGLPAAPLRVGAACVLFGTFFVVSGSSHAKHTTAQNVIYSAEIEARDLARRAAASRA